MTEVNDIVLIYLEESPLAFARLESIDPDIKRGWFHVKFLMLQIPLQVVTWILREAYINGETFTMGGKRMRIEKVVCPDEPAPMADEGPPPKEDAGESGKKGKVITLADLKKK